MAEEANIKYVCKSFYNYVTEDRQFEPNDIHSALILTDRHPYEHAIKILHISNNKYTKIAFAIRYPKQLLDKLYFIINNYDLPIGVSLLVYAKMGFVHDKLFDLYLKTCEK